MIAINVPSRLPNAAGATVISAEVAAYGQHLKQRLGNADWRWQIISDGADTDGEWLAATADLDLLVYVESERCWWRKHLPTSQARRLVERAQMSLLLVRWPRWPIRHILLIARADETDCHALDWVIRMAQPDRTHVSILPIVPPWPLLHRHSRWAQPAPDVLLASCTPCGTQVRHMVRRLYRRHIPAIVSLRRGEPDWQIRTEIDSGDPDLVVIAAESHNRALRLLCGELVAPLLRWIDRPLLIARHKSIKGNA